MIRKFLIAVWNKVECRVCGTPVNTWVKTCPKCGASL